MSTNLGYLFVEDELRHDERAGPDPAQHPPGLLPDSNWEVNFKMTVLVGYWELEVTLAVLGFSAEVHFLYHFLSKNIL